MSESLPTPQTDPTVIEAPTHRVLQVVDACLMQARTGLAGFAALGTAGEDTAGSTSVLARPNISVLSQATDDDLLALTRLDAAGNVASVVARLTLGEGIRLRLDAFKAADGEPAMVAERDRIGEVISRGVRSIETYRKVARNVADLDLSAATLTMLAEAAGDGWVAFEQKVASLVPVRIRGGGGGGGSKPPTPAEADDEKILAPFTRQATALGRDLAELILKRKEFALTAVTLSNKATCDVMAKIEDVEERRRVGEAAIAAIQKAMALDVEG